MTRKERALAFVAARMGNSFRTVEVARAIDVSSREANRVLQLLDEAGLLPAGAWRARKRAFTVAAARFFSVIHDGERARLNERSLSAATAERET